MAVKIRKAERRKAKLRLGLIGPTGSGKTYSALRLAFGLGGSVGIIDTENGSADLYADLGDYSVITLEKPYTVEKYREALQAFEDANFDTVIVDSLTHAWAGSGGLLDRQGQAEKRIGNSFTAWREITPQHNALVEALLTSPAHIIATLRVKTEYVLEQNEKGKTVPRKVGLAPVFRDGIEYEMGVVFDIDTDHKATASKDRTRLFDGHYDTLTERTGQKLREWLDAGEAVVEPMRAAAAPISRVPRVAEKPSVDRTDDQWRTWLTKLRDACGVLRNRQEVVEVGERDTVGDAMATGPDWVKREISSILAENYARFPDDDADAANDPERDAA